MIMLTCLLQQARATFDMQTANQLWKVLFLAMDAVLLGVIPIALLKDICCQSRQRGKKKRRGSYVASIFACSCFAIIFLVDALIFNMYFGSGSNDAKLSEVPKDEADGNSEKLSTWQELTMTQIASFATIFASY